MGITHVKTSGTVPPKITGTDWDVEHAADVALDDLTDVNAPTPADGDALVWDEGAGEWVPGEVAASGGSGTAFIGARAYNAGTQAVANVTYTAITLDSEEYDTDGFHSTSSNTSRFTVPAGLAGKYLINAQGYWNSAYTSYALNIAYFKKNGTTEIRGRTRQHVPGVGGGTEGTITQTVVVDLAGGDYIEWYVYQGSGSSKDLGVAGYETYVEITKIGSGGIAGSIGARAYSAATQSISDATITPLTFDTEDYDTNAIHDLSTNPSRFTVPAGLAGKWTFEGGSGWDTNATNTRYLWWRKNGADLNGGGAVEKPGNAQGAVLTTTITLDLAAGDYVELVAYQTSNGTRTIGNAGGDPKFRAWMSAALLQGGTGGGSGTAFPTGAATGTRFWRTDLEMEFFYNGTRWLSTTLYHMHFAGPGTTIAASAIIDSGPGFAAQFDIWIEDALFNYYPESPNDGSNFWTISLYRANIGSGDTQMVSFTTSAATDDAWNQSIQVEDALADTTTVRFYLYAARSASAGLLRATATMTYRRVAT